MTEVNAIKYWWINDSQFKKLQGEFESAVRTLDMPRINESREKLKTYNGSEEAWKGYCERSEYDEKADVIFRKHASITEEFKGTAANPEEFRSCVDTIISSFSEETRTEKQKINIVYTDIKIFNLFAKADQLLEKGENEAVRSEMQKLADASTAGLSLLAIGDKEVAEKNGGAGDPWFRFNIQFRIAQACIGLDQPDEALEQLKSLKSSLAAYYSGVPVEPDNVTKISLEGLLRSNIIGLSSQTTSVRRETSAFPQLIMNIMALELSALTRKEEAFIDQNGSDPEACRQALERIKGYSELALNIPEIYEFAIKGVDMKVMDGNTVARPLDIFDDPASNNPWLKVNMLKCEAKADLALADTSESTREQNISDARSSLAKALAHTLSYLPSFATANGDKMTISARKDMLAKMILDKGAEWTGEQVMSAIGEFEKSGDTKGAENTARLYLGIAAMMSQASIQEWRTVIDISKKDPSRSEAAGKRAAEIESDLVSLDKFAVKASEISGLAEQENIPLISLRMNLCDMESQKALDELGTDQEKASAMLDECINKWDAIEKQTGDSDNLKSLRAKISLNKAHLMFIRLSVSKESDAAAAPENLKTLEALFDQVPDDLLGSRDKLIKQFDLAQLNIKKYYLSAPHDESKAPQEEAAEALKQAKTLIKQVLAIPDLVKGSNPAQAELDAVKKALAGKESDIAARAAAELVAIKLIEAKKDLGAINQSKALIDLLKADSSFATMETTYKRNLDRLEIDALLKKYYSLKGSGQTGAAKQAFADTCAALDTFFGITGSTSESDSVKTTLSTETGVNAAYATFSLISARIEEAGNNSVKMAHIKELFAILKGSEAYKLMDAQTKKRIDNMEKNLGRSGGHSLNKSKIRSFEQMMDR